MKKEEILSQLADSSNLIRFGVEQNTIYDRLSKEEVREFLSSIVHTLPDYPETTIENLEYYCLSALEEEDKRLMINTKSKELLKLKLINRINKEQSALLILYLIIDFIDTYKTSVTKELNKASKYLLSYIIPSSIILYREIEYNPVKGKSIPHKDTYLRVTEDGIRFIPTRKTLKKFSNYLYTFKNNQL